MCVMSRKRKLLLIYGTLVLMLLGTVGWYVWQTLDAPAPRQAAKAMPKAKTPPAAKTADALADKPVPKVPSADATARGISPAPQPESGKAGKDISASPAPSIAETGNVGGLSSLHVQIEEYKLLVQIEELKAKLVELKKAQTVVAASPSPPVLSLAALTPPQSTEPPATAVQATPRRARGSVVLSIHGVDENLLAAVRLDSGKRVTLRKGEKFSGGVVVDISRNGGVVVRNGKNTTVLPFE
jgi:type IV pilus biogenesis protein PilP